MKKKYYIVTGLLLLFVSAVLVRWYVLHAQQGHNLPFTLESALQFRHVQTLYDHGRLPAQDVAVEHPEGVNVLETYTIGAEHVYAALAHCLPKSWSLTFRVRWIALFWFCLGVPLMVLWIRGFTRSWTGGFVAGVFYAVAISSVIRSTGQELSHENFALPLLLAHLAASSWIQTNHSTIRKSLLSMLSGLFLAVALVSWDLIQFYVYLWGTILVVDSIKGTLYQNKNKMRSKGVEGIALCLVAILTPYYRAHGLLFSPVFFAVFAVLLLGALRKIRLCTFTTHWWGRLGFVLLFLGGTLFVVQQYGESYGHFAELLLAKIRFLNKKPTDPSLLTFSQRIMWVPALNSANFRLTLRLFPAILPLSVLAIISLGRLKDTSQKIFNAELVFFYISSLVVFIFFVRFHVFASLFAAALLGCWAGQMKRCGGIRCWLVMLLLLVGAFTEACQTMNKPTRWGRPGVYYKETKELIEWLKENTEREPVLANFGISASIVTYAGNPIILHPKFETKKIRTKVEQYGNLLFKKNEEEFRAWAQQQGAAYYVYSIGEFSRILPERQMRYFVDALEPSEKAPARIFEKSPQSSRIFHLLWENKKYRVFDIVTEKEETQANFLSNEAYDSMCSGYLDEAEQLASKSLLFDMGNDQAKEVLLHVAELRRKTFNLTEMNNPQLFETHGLIAVAITGGIACGKSTVGSLLEKEGFLVKDTDDITQTLLLPGTACYQQVKRAFGAAILGSDGLIDKSKLAKIIFKDEKKRTQLNDIMHPAIWERCQRWIDQQHGQEKPLAVLVPLLFEANFDGGWSATICVSANEQQIMQRLQQRGLSEQEARERIEAQWSLEEKEKKSDIIIYNNHSPEELAQQVKKVAQHITGGWNQ